MISCLPFTNSARLRQLESGVYARATFSGSRVFQASSASRTFISADSRVNGGTGGRVSVDIKVLLSGFCRTARLDLKRFYSLAIPKSFIYCRQDKALPPGCFHPRMSSRLGVFKLLEMDGSHEVMFTRPAELADKIIEAGSD